ncbi:hypothetical protein [Caloranaerobacter sp. DY30410]|uniref:hypothetical protein n=1 Tax=Caloranaerobacter sp. DY30410 TaxID=3238305 RepID=UPI003CFFBC4D
MQASDQVSDQVGNNKINEEYMIKIKGDLLKLTIPNKPTSPKQKYYSEKIK